MTSRIVNDAGTVLATRRVGESAAGVTALLWCTSRPLRRSSIDPARSVWAVGSPAGPRSHTWSVVGHARNDDVFISLRDRMGVMKLSLHEAKWWMATPSGQPGGIAGVPGRHPKLDLR